MASLRPLLYILGAILTSSAAISAQSTNPARIMALGDSITGSPVSNYNIYTSLTDY